MKKIIPLITGINILILIILANLLISFAPNFRLDLTRTKIHSLSEVSRKTIKDLDDLVTVKVFMTKDLPSEIKPISQNLKTILNEMSLINRSKLRIEYLDPSTSDEARAEAVKYGIQALQFSTVKNDKFEVQNGYLGLAMLYVDRTEILPVAGDVGNLEYFLISGIKKLTGNESFSLALDEGGTVGGQSQLQLLRKYLSNNYKIIEFGVNDNNKLPEEADMMLVVGPTEKLNDSAKTKMKEWVSEGKGLILLMDKIRVNDSMQGETLGDLGWEELLKESGITIENKLVADENSSIANFRTQSGSFLTQYPYWVLVRPENIAYSLPVMSGINSLSLSWVSPMIIENEARSLFKSSQKSIAQENVSDLSPANKEVSVDKGEGNYVLGAVNTSGRKVAVVADSDFIKDQFVSNNQQNLALVLNLVDYFSQDASMLSIRSKSLSTYPLKQIGDSQKNFIRVINILSPLILLIGVALGGNLLRKRANQQWKEYET